MIDFAAQCQALGVPVPVAEHRFHPTRKWRLDFAWPERCVGLEVEGGVFVRGRHSRGAGMVKDMEKYNALALVGWRLLRVTPEDIANGNAALLAARALLPVEREQ